MIGSHVLAGYEPDRRGEDALALAAVVVRHTHGSLTIASIRPPAWPASGQGSADAEWEALLDGQAHASLERAARFVAERNLPRSTSVRYVVGVDRGSGRGLAHLVGRARADLIAIGSAPGGPRHGVSVGSTADQLLHGSPVPVMVAPKSYAERRLDGFDRITVAYVKRPGCESTVDFAAQVAAARKVPLRLLSLAVGGSDKGARRKLARLAEEQFRRVVDQYESDLATAAKAAEGGTVLTAERIQTEVAQGPDVAKAIAAADWSPGDLLVISSSDAGPIRKVFMGDMSLKILRAAPCPTVVLPRLGGR